MENQDVKKIQSFYDNVAEEYAEKFFDELSHKPLDRKILELFADRVRKAPGLVYEIGCGPGEISHYLHNLGIKIQGIDLSSEMVQTARKINPKIDFEQGNVLNLSFGDNTVNGIVAFYMIVHFSLEQVSKAFNEMFRVLAPNTYLLISFHIGNEVLHIEEFLGKNVTVDFVLFEKDMIVDILEKAGFEIDEIITRSPYKDVEYPSQRAYIFAHKP